MEQTAAPPRRRLHTLGSVLLGFLLAIAVALAALLVFVFSGVHDVAASAPESAWKTWLLDTAMTRSVEVHARDVVVPHDLESEARASAGAGPYQAMCAPCHAAPGMPQSEMARGMTPRPPTLEKVVARWSPREMFWIAHHGVEQTGMPAWGPSHDDEALWDIIAWMEHAAARGLNNQVIERNEAREQQHPQQPHAH